MIPRVCAILLGVSLVGACAAPTNDGAPTPTPTPTPTGSTSKPTTRQPSVATNLGTTSPSTSSPTSTTSSAGPMSSRPTPGAAGGLDCTSLRSAGFETRRELLADRPPEQAHDLAPECHELVTVTMEASALADRVAAVSATTIADLNARFSCTSTSFEFTVTNELTVAIGYYLLADIRAGPEISKEDALSAQAPAVVWRLDPGETTTTTGTFPDNDGFTTCSLAGSVFVADTDDLTGDPNPPSTVAGQPTERWFRELLERQADHEAAPSPDGVSRFEDLRSRSYATLVDAAAEAEPVGGEAIRRYTICDVLTSPEPHLTALVYQRDDPSVAADDDQHGDATELRFGVFRRGADGVWRWLGPALVFRAGLDSCEDYFTVDQ